RLDGPRGPGRRAQAGARARRVAGPGVHAGAHSQDLPDYRPDQGLRHPRHRGRGHHRPEVGEVAADHDTGPQMATVEVSFTPLPAHVRTARLVATAVARRSGVEEALLDEVRLAVGEACSRAVEAHQAQCPDEPVRVELTGANGRFEVVVTDAAASGQEDEDGASPSAQPGGWPAPASVVPNGTSALDHSVPPQGLG